MGITWRYLLKNGTPRAKPRHIHTHPNKKKRTKPKKSPGSINCTCAQTVSMLPLASFALSLGLSPSASSVGCVSVDSFSEDSNFNDLQIIWHTDYKHADEMPVVRLSCQVLFIYSSPPSAVPFLPFATYVPYYEEIRCCELPDTSVSRDSVPFPAVELWEIFAKLPVFQAITENSTDVQMKAPSLNECKYISVCSDQESPLEMRIPVLPGFRALVWVVLEHAKWVSFGWYPTQCLHYSGTFNVLQVLRGVWFMGDAAAHPT